MTLPGWLRRSTLALALFAGLLLVVATAREQASDVVEPPPVGLPKTPDYHALLVAADDPDRLWLGTHVGLYESRDGGRSWRVAGLEGEDAMNLAREKDGTLWAAGHEVLARSADGGRRWIPARPRGLPTFDIHAFAADRNDGVLYAAVAGEGLFRSDDGGESFRPVTDEVGGDVTSLAVAADGTLWAADAQEGLVANADGDGKEWRKRLDEAVRGVAASPGDGRRVIATTERGLLVTADGGRSWREAKAIENGAGPVAWAADASLAYGVGLDGKVYRTTDAGASWERVGPEPQRGSALRFRGSRPSGGVAAPGFALRDRTGELVRMRDLRG